MARPARDHTVEILRAAQTVLRDCGVRGTTIEAVAQRAGVGKGTVFLYWPSKARLLQALAALEGARLAEVQRRQVLGDPAAFSLGGFLVGQVEALWGSDYLSEFLADLGGVLELAEGRQRDGQRTRWAETEPDVARAAVAGGLIRAEDAVAAAETLAMLTAGAVLRGFDAPERRPGILAAVRRTVDAAFARADVCPEVARAVAHAVADVLDAHADRLVDQTRPERPTSADLRELAV